MNVVNAESCWQLHNMEAKRVTLSYELNKQQIKALQNAYYEANGGYPALEMVVYGRAPLLVTKYCPLKKMNLCGQCKKKRFEIRDEYGSFPVLSHEDCSTTILNGKVLNLLDEMPSIQGVEAFRLNFTIESAGEVFDVIKKAKGKLNGTLEETLFNQETDTRGHFNKEII
jgi:putative protease